MQYPSLMAKSSTTAPVSTIIRTALAASRKWAAGIYFFRIILQVPLFRVPCQSGMCSTPIHVISSQLIASDIFPVPVIKALLYPGALANGVVRNMTIPIWDNLLSIYNLTGLKEAPAVMDLQPLEVLAGSYFSVAGGPVGILKSGRMSLFGTLLVVWGLIAEAVLGNPVKTDPAKAAIMYPAVLLALICAYVSVNYDTKKNVRSALARPIAQLF